MARDIEEFLKRAAERRRQQQQAKNPPPAQQQPPRQEPRQQKAPMPARKKPAQLDRKPLYIDESGTVDDPYQGDTVADHVRSHIRPR